MTIQHKDPDKRICTTKHIISVAITEGKEPEVIFVHNAFSTRIRLKSIKSIAVSPISKTDKATLTLNLNKSNGVTSLRFTASYNTCMQAVQDFNFLVGMDED